MHISLTRKKKNLLKTEFVYVVLFLEITPVKQFVKKKVGNGKTCKIRSRLFEHYQAFSAELVKHFQCFNLSSDIFTLQIFYADCSDKVISF